MIREPLLVKSFYHQLSQDDGRVLDAEIIFGDITDLVSCPPEQAMVWKLYRSVP